MKSNIGLSLAALAACFALGLPAHAAFAKTRMVACQDGTHAKAGRGACSGHGGVAMTHAKTKAKAKAKAKAKKAEAKPKHAMATKPMAKMESHKAAKHEAAKHAAAKHAAATKSAEAGAAGATARCKDGSYSHAKGHRGACSGHGGVAEWLKH